MELTDTSREARTSQIAAYRSMPPAERVAIAVAMSEECRLITLAGIRRREPDLTPAEQQARFFEVLQAQRARS